MKFLNSITFKEDVTFESTRQDHKKNFKVKSRTYTEENRRRPIYDNSDSRIFGRHLGYEKQKVTEKTFVIFHKDYEMQFKPLTVIVGDNGCGKSSLLRYLKPPKDDSRFNLSNKSDEEIRQEEITKWLNNKKVKLDFTTNPEMIIIEQGIHKTSFSDNIGKGKISLSANDVLSKWNIANDSNGETTIDFLNCLKDIKNSLIILDEPETSLSITTQMKFAKMLKNLAACNQLIIVTHSPIFMKLSTEIYDFEKKEYAKTFKYLKPLKNYLS